MVIVSIIEELIDGDFLKKSIYGTAQNHNENSHIMIWDRIPKSKWVFMMQLQV